MKLSRGPTLGVLGVAFGAALAVLPLPGGGPALAAVVAIAAALSMELGLGLLILLTAVQDLPNGGPIGAYAGLIGALVGLAFHLVLTAALGGRGVLSMPRRLSVLLPLGALGVVAYTTAMSAVGPFEQSPDRPFALVGALAVTMIVAGWVLGVEVARSPRLTAAWGTASATVLLLLVVVVASQVVLGPTAFKSTEGVTLVLESAQLSGEGGLGQVRLTGLSGSPNALMLAAAFLVIGSSFAGARDEPGRGWRLTAVASVGFLFLASQSRATGLFALTVAFTLFVRSWRNWLRLIPAIGAMVLGAAGLYWWLASRGNQRIAAPELGIRADAWTAAVQDLPLGAWFTGTGFSHWPVFFGREVGVGMMDPHTAVLSVPGTFGVPGILLYIGLLAWLVPLLRAGGESASERVAILSLAAMVLVRDLVAVGYVVGNVPFTLHIWFLLGFLAVRTGRPRTASSPTPAPASVATTVPPKGLHRA